MNNIVKSVVFAAVVLFAGIAAMQVIYKEQPSVSRSDTPPPPEVMENLQLVVPDFVVNAFNQCIAKALETGNSTEVEKCNKAWEAAKK